MKKSILFLTMLLTCVVCAAKDVKTLVLTTQPQMHCENCENKIKAGLRHEKGMKDIVTSVPDQTVTITYDADKNTEEGLIAALKKIGYTATKVVPDTTTAKPRTCCGQCKNKQNKPEGQGCCRQGKPEGCGQGHGGCGAAQGGCPKKAVEEGSKPAGCCGAAQGGCPKKNQE